MTCGCSCTANASLSTLFIAFVAASWTAKNARMSHDRGAGEKRNNHRTSSSNDTQRGSRDARGVLSLNLEHARFSKSEYYLSKRGGNWHIRTTSRLGDNPQEHEAAALTVDRRSDVYTNFTATASRSQQDMISCSPCAPQTKLHDYSTWRSTAPEISAGTAASR